MKSKLISKPFTVGDVVKLKSGGPEMTIDYICTNTDCNCKWFNKDNDVKEHRFVSTTINSLEPIINVTCEECKLTGFYDNGNSYKSY
jgi:uncharacterized protein YodC (DUF2158 family)